MSDQQQAQPWDDDNPLGRYTGETRRANDALRGYWLMGPGRSLHKLQEQYCHQTDHEPPTKRPKTLAVWSSKYHWQARIDRAKEILDEVAQKEFEARRNEILGSGYALLFERVASLKELAELLYQELREEEKRWLPDVKQIGAGEDAERVNIVRFNAQLIEQYRRTLDDIAAELGARVRGLKLQGSVGVAAITADDLAQARDEAEKWEKERFGDLDDDGE